MKVNLIILSLVVLLSLDLCRPVDVDFEDLFDNPYRDLKVAPWSSMQEIKTRYNELVVKYHPDRNKKTGSKEKFIKIQNAYEKLKKSRKAQEEEEDDGPLDTVIMDVVTISLAVIFIMSMIYFSLLFTFKIYSYIWKFLTLTSIVIIGIDKLFPHYFMALTSQLLYSFIFSVCIYCLPKILMGISNIFKKKNLSDDLVNDIKTDKRKKRN